MRCRLALVLAACSIILLPAATRGHVLEFTVEPTDTVVEAGQSAVLDCVVKAAQHQSSVLIQWMDKDALKLNFLGDTYRNQLTNGSLYISNITEELGLTGTYQCMATLPNVGSIISRTAKLTISRLYGFEEEPQNQSVFLGQKAHFACSVNASPPTKIRWLKDERPLLIDELRMTVLPSGALEIDEVQESDLGWYRCNATGFNRHLISERANLAIRGDQAALETAPNFIYEPKNTVVIEGQNVSLDCAANGNPIPVITWLKDGYNIDMNDLDSRFSLVGSTNSLRITNIKEEDAGTYQCRAENKVESFDKSSIVQVQVPPRFLRKPQDKIEHVSNNVELECEIYAQPKPKIQWYKNGEPIVLNEYYKNVNGHNLKITGLLSSDSGLFQCFAANPAGNIQASASLKVLAQPEKRPIKSKSKPKKSRPQNDQDSVHKKQSKSIFDALKPDELGETSFGFNQDESRRLFSSLKSSEGDLSLGQLGDIQSAYLPTPQYNPTNLANTERVAEGLPGPPQDLKALMVKAKFIILGWSPPTENSDNIQMYSVYYRQEGSDRELFQNTSRSRLEEMSIQTLSPGKVYHFRVVAYNNLGPGMTSQTLTITTQFEEHVSSAPQYFEVFPTSARSVHLSWEQPENPNGVVKSYNAFYMETISSLEHKIETVDLQYELTGLLPYTEYIIWVVAVNDNGPGAATEEKLVRTFGDVPSEPPNNVTIEPKSTSAVIRWQPPPKESQNGIILGYKIKYRRQGKSKSVSLQTPNVNQHIIKDLERGSPYQIRLWALNINGTSPSTEWINLNTFENDVDETQVPDKPAALNARSNSDVLYVIWSAPNNQNTRVRNYILGWGKGVSDTYSIELGETNRTHLIKNLEPNSEYVLSIRASNQMGTGPPRYFTVRTQDEPPEPAQELMPPIGLKAHVITPSSVVLYWTDPTLNKNQIVRDNRVYIIQYTAEKSLKTKHQNTTNLNIMIDDLKPNTLYEYAVKLVRGSKESPWSMVVTNRTFELPPIAPRELDIHFKDDDGHLVELTWQPPRINSGRITGYVILFTEDKSKNDREWSAIAIKGDNHSCVFYDLKPLTQYFFKVQARNSRGYGPFSSTESFRTGQNVATLGRIESNSDSQGVFSKSFLLYLIGVGCFVAIATVAGVIIFYCCRKKDVSTTTSPDRSKKGYQMGNQNIKPPDLWIHHDQMELKAMEKRHSNNDGASSSGAMTLPRSVGGNDYDNHDGMNTNSLDKRTYTSSNYGAIATPINTATLSQSSSDSTPSSRPSYQRPPGTQYSMPRTQLMGGEGHTPSMEYSAHLGHNTYDGSVPPTNYTVPPIAPNTTYAPGANYAPGMNILAEQAAKRAQAGQGHPLKSFTVPAPPPISAPGTPQPKHIVTVRPTSSPFKKAPPSGGTGTPLGTPPSRISTSNPPPHTPEEVQRLHSSHSTEELNQEMANLEGLMLTLNAITANEFEC